MAEAYKVGCSISKYTEKNRRYSLMACNYAVTNMDSMPIYEDGPTASGCQTGTNPNFPGLCSVNEKYTTQQYFRPDYKY